MTINYWGVLCNDANEFWKHNCFFPGGDRRFSSGAASQRQPPESQTLSEAKRLAVTRNSDARRTEQRWAAEQEQEQGRSSASPARRVTLRHGSLSTFSNVVTLSEPLFATPVSHEQHHLSLSIFGSPYLSYMSSTIVYCPFFIIWIVPISDFGLLLSNFEPF